MVNLKTKKKQVLDLLVTYYEVHRNGRNIIVAVTKFYLV